MPISAQELRRKLAEKRKQKAFETSPEQPAEASAGSSNNAGSAEQVQDSARKQKFDVRRIKQLLLERIAQLAQYLYPNGKLKGNHWRVGSIEGEPGRSFDICIAGEKAGFHGDFAEGGKHSKSALDLWMGAHKCDFKTALHEAAEWLGETPVQASKPRSKSRSPQTFLTLEAAIGSAERMLEMRATRRDWYHDRDGNKHFVVVRFDGNKPKEFRPFHRNEAGWVMADPSGKLPLFDLPELLRPDLNPSSEPVFVVEGEKCVCGLETLSLLATTSAHGAKCAQNRLAAAGRP